MKQEGIESTELNLNNLIDESEFLENPIGIKSPLENGKHYELFEIFNSVEGEFPKSGEFVTFVRFPICNYSCHWCFGILKDNHKPKLQLESNRLVQHIDSVTVGQKIYTLNQNKEKVVTEVIDAKSRFVDKYLKIKISDVSYGVTYDHPFMTIRGMVPASELILNDVIISDEFIEGLIVESIEHIDEELEVFNITCSPYNSYLIDNMWVHNCDTMKNPENKPLWFKYEDIKKSVIMSEALTFTGGEASLFLSDMVDIINRLIKDNVYLKYVKVETNGSNLELMDKTFRHHFEKYFGEEYEEKFILCWSPKLMTKDYFKTAMNTINVFNPRNMVVKIVMDPNVKDKLQTFIERFIYIHGQKGKNVFSMMPLSVVSRGNTTGQIQPDSLKLIKEYTKKGFAVGLRVHEALRVR